MLSVFALYIIALCSILIALCCVVSLGFLISIRRRLVNRDKARGQAYMMLRQQLTRIEEILIAARRRLQEKTEGAASS